MLMEIPKNAGRQDSSALCEVPLSVETSDEPNLRSGGRRIFVVDDESLVAETLCIILRREGFHCTCFTNPLIALRVARIEPPDLLISDITMPQLSGIDLAIQIDRDVVGCKVLLISGQANTVDLLFTARQRGHVFELHAKPLHPSELLVRVRNLLLGSPPSSRLE
jgi:DNA-binding response OmpR family regulator